MKQMVEAFNETQSTILASETIEGPAISAYGVLDCTPDAKNPRLLDVRNMVEKPKFEDAPSKNAIIGRYILTPRIFEMLETITPGAGGELQLTDGIKALLKYEKVYGFHYEGKRHDAGDKQGFLRAHRGVRPQTQRPRARLPRLAQNPYPLGLLCHNQSLRLLEQATKTFVRTLWLVKANNVICPCNQGQLRSSPNYPNLLFPSEVTHVQCTPGCHRRSRHRFQRIRPLRSSNHHSLYIRCIIANGHLSGTQFSGNASYDNQGETGVGTEFFTLTSLNFSLLGFPFTRADISQGGQAILENGTLAYFTAAFFPTSPSSPVTDIAFGFGGPGIIGYVTSGDNFGSGVYTIAPIPEPSTFLLSGIALCCSAFLFRQLWSRDKAL